MLSMDAVYKYTSDLLREVSSVVVAAAVAVILTRRHFLALAYVPLPLNLRILELRRVRRRASARSTASRVA